MIAIQMKERNSMCSPAFTFIRHKHIVVVLQTTAGWRKAPALAQRVCTQGVASLRSISLKNTRNPAGFRVVRAAGA